jgi:hypothetical protein
VIVNPGLVCRLVMGRESTGRRDSSGAGRLTPGTGLTRARTFLAAAIADCPVAADAVLCLSELATNSVLHSASREPGGTFTVRAYVRIEVEDADGPWQARIPDGDSRPHGLEIVRAIAADYGVTGGALAGRVAWARLDWPDSPAATALQGH